MALVESVTRPLLAGLVAGVLTFVLTVRLNPELDLHGASMLVGTVLWATWGLIWLGLPLLVVTGAARRLRGGHRSHWPHAAVLAAVYFLAAALFSLNADVHPEFLPEEVTRLLRLDAVIWLGFSLAVGAAVLWLGEVQRRVPWRVALVVAGLALPVLRLSLAPTPPRSASVVEARPLGRAARPLLVIGLEGLDAKVLLAHAAGDRFPALERFLAEGAWAPVDAYTPYLRRSLWTSVATGAYPRRHGVESRWGWRLRVVSPEPLRLLPWPQQAFQWTLPWGLASRQDPPPTALPPLWERVGATGATPVVLHWPGIWRRAYDVAGESTPRRVDQDFADSLRAVLLPFPDQRDEILEAIRGDVARFGAAADALGEGAPNVWVHLGSLSEVRRHLEPHHAADTDERQAMELVLELLDARIGSLLDAASPSALVVLVSPYGLEPPDSLERLLRLLGAARQWRATPRTCPDGAVLVLGRGVAPGRRLERVQVTDIAPSLSYLLGLPLAQYMEGRVMVDAVEPTFLAAHPLRVVD